MRLFAGITIPQSIRDEIDDLIDSVQSGSEKVKWVKKENFHITLRFIGEVGEDRVGPLCRGLMNVGRNKTPFRISLSTVGAFPTMKFPRVYWIGVDQGEGMVRCLHNDINDELRKFGHDPEGKRFHPHVTIGRVRKTGVQCQFPEDRTHFGEFLSEDFCLFKSTLTKRGPIYDIIEKIDFLG